MEKPVRVTLKRCGYLQQITRTGYYPALYSVNRLLANPGEFSQCDLCHVELFTSLFYSSCQGHSCHLLQF
nr:MAG TPA: hypothetical protein [Caudoviricetes sp.]